MFKKKVQTAEKLQFPRLDQGAPKAFEEAYRTLRANLMFSEETNGAKRIVLAAPARDEHIGNFTWNLATVLAGEKSRVLIVDCDLTDRWVSRELAISDTLPGIAQVICGEYGMVDCLVTTPKENVSLLPAGNFSGDSAELFSGKRIEELQELVQKDFDYVLYVAPAVTETTDATVLSRKAVSDGMLLVLCPESATIQASQFAMDKLEDAGGHVLGAVLNGYDPEKGVKQDGYYDIYTR
jgi:capsular exopolysaccharide synthesis family protein